MTVPGREDRVPGLAEVEEVATAETKAVVAPDKDKTKARGAVAPAARAVVGARDRAESDGEGTGETDSNVF